MMAPQSFTVFVASNRGEKAWRFNLSSSWLKALGFCAFVLVLFVATAIVDYAGLVTKSREHEALVRENLNLKQQNDSLAAKFLAMADNLSKFKRLTAKLKIITNVRAPEGTSAASAEGAVPVAVNAELESIVGRAPASRSEMTDSLTTLAENVFVESQLREQELMSTWDLISDRQNLLAATPTIKPTHGYYSSFFGYRVDPINGRHLPHAGVDIAAPYGTEVLAPADGVVSYTGSEGGYGNLVSIDHGYGVITRFGHNSRVFVHAGQKVHRWDVISAVGSTGHSTGSHVHYEVLLHGVPVDPINYILQEN